jgi:hypothetical protein
MVYDLDFELMKWESMRAMIVPILIIIRIIHAMVTL